MYEAEYPPVANASLSGYSVNLIGSIPLNFTGSIFNIANNGTLPTANYQITIDHYAANSSLLNSGNLTIHTDGTYVYSNSGQWTLNPTDIIQLRCSSIPDTTLNGFFGTIFAVSN